MQMQLISIGYGNVISGDRIVAIVSPDAAPVKRLAAKAKEDGMLIDASCGRKTKSVIVTDSDHVILSALPPEKIVERAAEEENTEERF